MQIRAAIFDLYYTLLVERSDNPFYEAVAKDLGFTLAEFMPTYLACGKATMRGELNGMSGRVSEACKMAGWLVDDRVIDDVVMTRMELFYKSISLYPDALTTLSQLKMAGFRLGIVSNASAYSEEVLRRTGLAFATDTIVMSYKEKLLKPHPDIYIRACRRLGLPPSEVVFIGDGGDDELQGARQIGMQTILIDRHLKHSDAARPFADHTAEALSGVAGLISTLQLRPHPHGVGALSA